MEENGFVNMQSQEVHEDRIKQDTLGYRNAKTERFVFCNMVACTVMILLAMPTLRV